MKIEANHKGFESNDYHYTYSTLKKLFDLQGDDKEASEYYVKEKELDRELSSGLKYLANSMSYHYWRYGNKPERVVYFSILLIFLCAFFYFLFPQFIKPIEDPKTFLDALYFSVVTFTTLGYGDLSPIGWLRTVALLEAFLGAINLGFIVAGFSRNKY